MITECPYCSKNAISWYRKLVIFNKFTCLSCNKALVLSKTGKLIISFVLGCVFLFLWHQVEVPMIIAIGIAIVLILPFKLLLSIKRSQLEEFESVDKSYFGLGFIAYILAVLAFIAHLNGSDYYIYGRKWEQITNNNTAQSYSHYFYYKAFLKGNPSAPYQLRWSEYNSKNWLNCATWDIVGSKVDFNYQLSLGSSSCLNKLTGEDLFKAEMKADDFLKLWMQRKK